MTGIGLDRLSLNQATVKHLGLADAVALCVRHGIPAIGLWRDRVAEAGLSSAVAAVRDAGLHVSSLCRGGFFTRADAEGGRRRGRTTGRPCGRRPSWARTRWSWCAAGWCRGAGISAWPGGWWPTRSASWCRWRSDWGPAGIEALHPMFCADRCVIASLGEAVDLALMFPAGAVGVVVDTYHVWWDVRLAAEIARAAGRIVSYQVCDWVLPLPADVLLGRGHLGDGVIDFGPVSAAVAAAGYRGYVEVEIFNAGVWDAPADQTAATVRERFAAVLGGRGWRGP